MSDPAASRRALPRQTRWQPIETAPKDARVDIWCSSADGVTQWRETDCWWNDKRKLWCNVQGKWDEATATHWMPLPLNPDEADPFLTALEAREQEIAALKKELSATKGSL